MNKQTGIGEEIAKRVEKLASGRTTWESHWDEIARRVLPAYSDSFSNLGSPMSNKGEKQTELMFDSTASNALLRFSAAMESMLTPRNAKWHRIRPTDPYLLKDRDTRLWFDEVNDLLFHYRYSTKANYASQQHENYMSLGAFGTGCMFIDGMKGGGLRYRAIHLGEIYFCENHQGLIDSAYRKFPYTARQACQMWGDKAPKRCKDAMEKDPEQEFFFIHAVLPRDDYDPIRIDFKGMPYASYYVSCDDKVVLSESGYQTFPYSISRYVTAPGETYGRSPAMMVLPAIKVLNEEKKTLLKQGHRAVDPVLLAHDDGVLDTFSLKPGALNYGGVSADGRPLVHALPTGNLAVGKDMMDDERFAINEAFLVTLFQILVDTPQMTATEVIERSREKGALLSPTMGRQQSEALGPQIERELDLLSRQRLLPPIPPALKEAGGDYQIEYDSPLSRSQKAEEAAGLMRTAEFATQVAANTQNPEPLDHFNWDIIMPELADMNAVPTRWLRSKEDVEAIREGRNQQVDQQNLVNALPGAAAMTKAIATTQQ
jgi:hypothetical protein